VFDALLDLSIPRRLSDDQLDAIIQEASAAFFLGDSESRQRSESLMRLIQHVAYLEGRTCASCRCWVAYNRSLSEAHRGECTSPDLGKRIQDPLAPAFVTPFDWGCEDWQERPKEEVEAQCRKA
jgi:hypothetical protein